MDPRYRIDDPSQIISPGLVVFREILDENIDKMIAISGDPGRLRPHCKTHKMRQVTEIELERGITKHKCATFAEAEVLVAAGVKDVCLAYNMVGPNIDRAVKFRQKFPEVTLIVTADHPKPVAELGRAMADAGSTIGVLLDVDTGMHRTGIMLGQEAEALYAQISDTAGLEAEGLHVYDGQNHQTDLAERTAAVQATWEPVAKFRDRLVERGLSVPRIVCGGTGSFPVFAKMDDPAIELSPGTCVFHDVGYGQVFPDLDFTPAAVLLTRVVSRTGDRLLTCDLGYKACASDPPAGNRLAFPELPDAKEHLQNEEHLVLVTDQADRFQPGDTLLAISRHACPTSALHKQAYVVEGGKVVDHWDVASRDRWLTV